MRITTPRHQKQRPNLVAKIAPAVTARKAVVFGGAALTLPVTAASTLTAPAGAAVAPVKAATPVQTTSVASTVRTTPAPTVVSLKYGSTGALVKTLQQRLGITQDGSFGPATLAAVRAFQTQKGLPVDGQVGPTTWQALGGYPGTGTTTTEPPTTRPPACEVTTLRYGSNGALVTALQRRLGGNVAADGDFGPATLAAVRALQSSKGLPVTGVVDTATWTAAGGYPCDVTTTPDTPDTPDVPTNGTLGQRIIAQAKQYLGVPYVWGGATPAGGFDCSGLTQYTFAKLGITIPRVASAQQRFFTPVTTPQPGDLVFFGTPAYHMGIWISEGTMLAAPYPGQVVRIQPIYNTPSGYGRYTG